MQKIFTQQLRFKQDNGRPFPDWESKKLNKIGERQTLKNTDASITRVLTNSATRGVLDQQDYFDKAIANADNLGGYYIVDKGDYVYNPRISVHAPVGPINKNKVGKGVMSPLYSIFRFTNENNVFYEKYFQTSFWHKYMSSVANYGARHDRMNISTADFMAMPLPAPHPDEQEKITDFLTAIDTKIDAVTQQITQIETFKKGLLQKMFV
jgi:type I restriction enzyme S subunit